MASPFSSLQGNGHLDPVPGREVVYCHDCNHEWYRAERDPLQCTRCSSDFTEIIEPHSDPRDMDDFPSPPPDFSRFGFGFRNPRAASYSDPDEGDVDDYLQSGRRGFFPRQPSRFSPPGPRESNDPLPDHGDGDATMRRFADMLRNMNDGAARGPPPPPSFHSRRTPDDLHFPAFPRVQRAAFRSGPISVDATSVTITTGRGGPGSDFGTYVFLGHPRIPGPVRRTNNRGAPRLFAHIMNPALPPDANDRNRQVGAGLQQFGFLQEFLSTLLNPQMAVHGDGVYTQEALDRIITTLMEANPQSNAAPPASQTAIEQLEQKQVDDEMLGSEGKAECTICIEELHKGDQVLFLPCKHWFHGDCVKLWLRQHNTCPICRAPIEAGGDGRNNAQQQQAPDAATEQRQQPRIPTAAPNVLFPEPLSFPSPSSHQPSQAGRPERPERPDRLRTFRENEQRLNYIRTAAGLPPPSSRPRQSRHPSLSPSSSRTYSFSDNPASDRDTSPSLPRDRDEESGPSQLRQDNWNLSISGGVYGGSNASRRRPGSGERDNRDGQTSHNPLNWLRDHLGRGPNRNSERDRRR
ncbi:hypothetical protein B0T26DRAFT_317932 [Lasiosphaeria miniovina]|uniref:RING-type E3 ubiquitin transferase n=1 Tax=Lasiosphaeria miniovina TaxID=1954250 RepID=A0AA40DWI0_9PEZI|nr:uncharacterized protein B0T26DRAFT_317932 [Lasiosphaeria miniovina]KAK0718175.1 hypothetical protein B0T26DRAFT_317932 [Lasiosphaeria miniovina]